MPGECGASASRASAAAMNAIRLNMGCLLDLRYTRGHPMAPARRCSAAGLVTGEGAAAQPRDAGILVAAELAVDRPARDAQHAGQLGLCEREGHLDPIRRDATLLLGHPLQAAGEALVQVEDVGVLQPLVRAAQ